MILKFIIQMIILCIFAANLYAATTAVDDLFTAIKLKNVAKVKGLIAAKVDVNEANEKNFTPLYRAVVEGNSEIVKILLDAGANPKGGKDNTFLPLIAAIVNFTKNIDGPEIFELVLSRGADPKQPDKYNVTALNLAINTEQLELSLIHISEPTRPY